MGLDGPRVPWWSWARMIPIHMGNGEWKGRAADKRVRLLRHSHNLSKGQLENPCFARQRRYCLLQHVV